MASLYADENFHARVVDELRQLGHDVLTAHQAGQAGKGIPDPDVLAFAVSLRRAVLTHNRRDFIRLHRSTPSHFGIVVCTNDDDFSAAARRIHQVIVAHAPLDNKLMRVNKPPTP